SLSQAPLLATAARRAGPGISASLLDLPHLMVWLAMGRPQEVEAAAILAAARRLVRAARWLCGAPATSGRWSHSLPASARCRSSVRITKVDADVRPVFT
ncbi:unnamed protein product, partial [Urochloa humidicola]